MSCYKARNKAGMDQAARCSFPGFAQASKLWCGDSLRTQSRTIAPGAGDSFKTSTVEASRFLLPVLKGVVLGTARLK